LSIQRGSMPLGPVREILHTEGMLSLGHHRGARKISTTSRASEQRKEETSEKKGGGSYMLGKKTAKRFAFLGVEKTPFSVQTSPPIDHVPYGVSRKHEKKRKGLTSKLTDYLKKTTLILQSLMRRGGVWFRHQLKKEITQACKVSNY